MPALSVRNLTMTFVEHNLFSDVSFDVEHHDKVGFIGANGVGKTTLFKILNGELAPTSGVVAFDKNAKAGYMEQHACNNPELDIYHELLSVFSYLAEIEAETEEVTRAIEQKIGNLDELVERQTQLIEKYERLGGLTYKSRTRSALLGLGFAEADFDMPVGSLSGGQRSKLCLAKLLLSQSNFLLLDEPTNHMDIVGKETLEDMLLEYEGTLIFVSHDRYFVKKLADKLLVFENGTAAWYEYGFDQYESERREHPTVEAAVRAEPKSKKTYTTPAKEKARRERALKKCEEKIALLEEKIGGIREELSFDENASDYLKLSELQAELDETETELSVALSEWEKLAEEMEQ